MAFRADSNFGLKTCTKCDTNQKCGILTTQLMNRRRALTFSMKRYDFFLVGDSHLWNAWFICIPLTIVIEIMINPAMSHTLGLQG